MICQACNLKCRKYGKHPNGLQKYKCPKCSKNYTEDHMRLFGAMTVPEDKALLAIQLLLEGTSVRTAERVTGLHRESIIRLLVAAGQRSITLLDRRMPNLACDYIQSDEIWTFVGKKQRHV